MLCHVCVLFVDTASTGRSRVGQALGTRACTMWMTATMQPSGEGPEREGAERLRSTPPPPPDPNVQTATTVDRHRLCPVCHCRAPASPRTAARPEPTLGWHIQHGHLTHAQTTTPRKRPCRQRCTSDGGSLMSCSVGASCAESGASRLVCAETSAHPSATWCDHVGAPYLQARTRATYQDRFHCLQAASISGSPFCLQAASSSQASAPFS